MKKVLPVAAIVLGLAVIFVLRRVESLPADAPPMLVVQLPRALKSTASPDVAVALTMKSATPKVLSPSGANVIAWSALALALLIAAFTAPFTTNETR